MPWHIGSSESCPMSKPFAVVKDADGSVAGCHPTKMAAKKQMAALYASETNALDGAEQEWRTTMTDAERRFTSVPVEIRTGSERRTIGGYAAKFTPAISQNLGGFKEQIAPGAFNRAASRAWPDVQARYNHEDSMLLGTTGGGSLRLAVNDTGLQYEVDMLDDAISERIYKLVQRGDVRQSSFAFVKEDDDWATDDTGYPLRTLHQVQLIDVAPVNTPAYLDTTAAVRSLAAKMGADPEEVRSMASRNELVRFFKRTDNAVDPRVKRRSAQAALARILALDPDANL